MRAPVSGTVGTPVEEDSEEEVVYDDDDDEEKFGHCIGNIADGFDDEFDVKYEVE